MKVRSGPTAWQHRRNDLPNRSRGRERATLESISVRRNLSNEAVVAIVVRQLQHLVEKLMDVGFTKFAEQIISTLRNWKSQNLETNAPAVFTSLSQAYFDRALVGLDAQIKYAYHGELANRNISESGLQTQVKLADLRYPVEWYPATRVLQRDIHLHVGPTNSGKTYHALKRLEQAKSGIYAGPLRLLAHEVYTRLNARGIPCNLITGDERLIREGEDVGISSCTVEMVPINMKTEVAVIDEIQMIGDEDRGWAWTQAFLGLQAQEIHLCGEERTVPLIRELAVAMGDKLEIHHYERLSPLKTMTTSLRGDLTALRKGDCVVLFSRIAIHAMKKEIERITKKRVAVVYGSLPPETRAQQARLFNDPDNDYDILVASDAIGMGLNLYVSRFLIFYHTHRYRSIKRIIFDTTLKFNGQTFETISSSSIKQIGGRAGRYRTAAQANDMKPLSEDSNDDVTTMPKKLSMASAVQNLGLITTLDPVDLGVVRKAMATDADPIMSAGIFPPTSILLQFAAHYPVKIPFSYILMRLHELALKHPRFHLCILKDQVQIADAIEPVKELTINDRITFTAAPVDMRSPKMAEILQALARCVANNGGGALLDIREINLDILDLEVTSDKEYLTTLEALHKALVLYLWLSYRFNGVFSNQRMAFYVKSLAEEKIDQVLARATYDKEKRKIMKSQRQKELLRNLQIGLEDIDGQHDEQITESPGSSKNQLSPKQKKQILDYPAIPTTSHFATAA